MHMAEAKAKAEVAERDERIQRYELVYLVANKFSEDEVGPIMADVAGLLKKNGAKIVREENWGKRRLAYPIAHYRHAYYAFLEFDMPREGGPVVENNLRLDERIMRHLLVKTRVKTAEEIEAERKAMAQLQEEVADKARAAKEKEAADTAREQRRPAPRAYERKEKEEGSAEAADADKSDAGKVSMEKLDEKLDKIIDDAGKLV